MKDTRMILKALILLKGKLVSRTQYKGYIHTKFLCLQVEKMT
jgi:hypothetical protein